MRTTAFLFVVWGVRLTCASSEEHKHQKITSSYLRNTPAAAAATTSRQLQSPCPLRDPLVDFTSTVLVTLDTPLVSEEGQEALISAASLAAIILEDSPTICNPYFSQVTAATAILDTSTNGSQQSNQVALQLSGICQGCDAVNTDLFQVDATPLLLTSTTGVCECPPDVVQRLPILQEFTDTMNAALQEFEVLEVELAESRPCGGDDNPTAFTTSVILELNGICSGLSAADADAVAAAYVKSYNAARVDEVCDPYRRHLISADVVEQGSPVGDTLSIVLEVTGELSCLDEDNSESCTLEEIGLYDLPTTIVQVEDSRRERRQLQTSLCVCLDGTPDRGLYEDEFIDALRVELQGTMLECPTLTTGICDNTVFESAFSLTFEDSDAALAFLEGPSGATLEQDTLQFLNQVYNPDDPSLCNPEFRQFEKVEYIILDDDGRRQRSLQDSNETDIDEDMDLNATFAPTPAPTFAPPSGLSVILSASGVCTGCSNDLFFGNAIDGRRLTMERDLQAATEATSTCFCGLDTTVVIPSPEIAELELFVESSTSLEVSGIVPISLEDPEDGDIYTYPCTDEITTFLRNITLEVQYECLASSDNAEELLTLEEKTLIASAFQTAYNTLRAEVCDPFNVQVLEAEVLREGELREAGTSLPLEMEVTVGCNGCDKELTDLYGFPDDAVDATLVLEARRVLEEAMPFGSNFLPVTTSRQTQELDGVCSCNATLPRRSPLEADVTDTMNPLLEELDLPCVGNTSECDFGRTFTTNILLEIEISPGVEPEEAARLLQIAYTNTLSRIISGGNATQCNSLFGLVLDSEFFLDFVYNSVPRGVNETSIDILRRQLQIMEDDPLIDTDGGNETDILNATDVPTMAPTVTFAPTFTPGPTTASILIFASGVCNGCPSDLFFGNAIDGRRLLTEGTTSEVEIKSTDDSNSRFLQDVTTPAVPESDCFCPVGSIDTASAFEPEVFTTALQAEIEDVAPGLNITSEPTYGVSEIDCSEETEFGTIVNFEFSAFQFVEEESNIGDVQGLGEVIAEIYNRLVPEFCDRFSRNSIQLTYIQGSLQPIGVGRRDRDRDLQRDLQTVTTGCFNYVASFSVVGKCRGCLDLNSPIPVFGNSEVQQRDRNLLSSSLMDRSINDALRQRNIMGVLWEDGANGDGIRNLQEKDETTCVCDASAVAARTAPSLSAVQEGLSNEIGGTLPWDRYPSICGLPVAVEEECPLVPESNNELSYQSPLSIARIDNACLISYDFFLVGNIFVETFNEALQQEFDKCSPEYMQITSVFVNTPTLPACNRRLESRNLNDLTETELQLRIQGSPFLQEDLQQLFVSLVYQDGQSTGARVRRLADSINSQFESAAASNGYRVILESSTTSPSGSPTDTPSAGPSSSPTPAPTGSPSVSPSAGPTERADCASNSAGDLPVSPFTIGPVQSIPDLVTLLTTCSEDLEINYSGYSAIMHEQAAGANDAAIELRYDVLPSFDFGALTIPNSPPDACDDLICPTNALIEISCMFGPDIQCCEPVPVAETELFVLLSDSEGAYDYRINAPCFGSSPGDYIDASSVGGCNSEGGCQIEFTAHDVSCVDVFQLGGFFQGPRQRKARRLELEGPDSSDPTYIVIPADLCGEGESLLFGLYSDGGFAEARVYAYGSDVPLEETRCFDYSRFTQDPFVEGGNIFARCGSESCTELEISDFGTADHIILRLEVIFGNPQGVELSCRAPTASPSTSPSSNPTEKANCDANSVGTLPVSSFTTGPQVPIADLFNTLSLVDCTSLYGQDYSEYPAIMHEQAAGTNDAAIELRYEGVPSFDFGALTIPNSFPVPCDNLDGCPADALGGISCVSGPGIQCCEPVPVLQTDLLVLLSDSPGAFDYRINAPCFGSSPGDSIDASSVGGCGSGGGCQIEFTTQDASCVDAFLLNGLIRQRKTRRTENTARRLELVGPTSDDPFYIVVPANLCSGGDSLFFGFYGGAFVDADVYAYGSDAPIEQTRCFDYAPFFGDPFGECSTYVFCVEGSCNRQELSDFGSANHIILRFDVYSNEKPEGVELSCQAPV